VVYAGGQPKYYARPFATPTHEIWLQVVGKIPKELEAHYRR
jgi:hypothetical protein